MDGGRRWLGSSGADRYLSESQVQHESLLSHGCEEGTRHRGRVRSFMLPKHLKHSQLPVLVNPSLMLFLFWMLRFEECMGQ